MSNPDWSPPGRRSILSGIATAAVVGGAGCSSALGSTTTLSAEIEENRSVTTMLFSDGDDVRFSLRILNKGTGDDPRQYYPLSIGTGDQGDLNLSSLTLEFYRLGPESLFLGDMPKSLADTVDFYRSDDARRTVLELPDPDGVYARGSLQFPVIFRPSDERPHQLAGRVDATLVDEGLRNREYIARTQFDTEIR